MPVYFAVLMRKLVRIAKQLSDRFVVKNFVSNGKELNPLNWFSWTFIKNLTLRQLLGLGIIASFTLITFPLGIWVSSFSMGLSLPMVGIINHLFEIALLPLNIFLINKTLYEFEINRTTMTGLAIILVCHAFIAFGYYLMLRGNQA